MSAKLTLPQINKQMEKESISKEHKKALERKKVALENNSEILKKNDY